MADMDPYFGWYSDQRALGDHGGMDVRQRLKVLCSAAAESFAAAKIWGVWLMRILVVLLRGEYALKE
jgi:hypothetical protein